MRRSLVREMAAKTVFVFLYGGMVEGQERYLRPSHIYMFTSAQAMLIEDNERLFWVANSLRPGFRPAGDRWYADNTREPIRDETLRFGLCEVGAVGRREGVATTSSAPIYFLKADFAALFDPDLSHASLGEAIDRWQVKHLSPAARARMTMLRASRVMSGGQVRVTCPDHSVAVLAPGHSSVISKAVVEQFAQIFLTRPALIWLSESGNKVRHQDVTLANALGLKIDQSRILPDIILANIGQSGEDTILVFIEVVASDGPMSDSRRRSLLEYVEGSSFPPQQCFFGTAFLDRSNPAFRKCIDELAWETFIWFMAEPENLIWLHGNPPRFA